MDNKILLIGLGMMFLLAGCESINLGNYVVLIENSADINYNYAVFEIRNPNPTTLQFKMTDVWLDQRFGHSKKLDLYELTNETYQIKLNDFSTCYKDVNGTNTAYDCLTGSHNITQQKQYWKQIGILNPRNINVQAHNKRIFKLVEEHDLLKPRQKYSSDWNFNFEYEGQQYSTTDPSLQYAWWNASWQNAVNFTVFNKETAYNTKHFNVTMLVDGKGTANKTSVRILCNNSIAYFSNKTAIGGATNTTFVVYFPQGLKKNWNTTCTVYYNSTGVNSNAYYWNYSDIVELGQTPLSVHFVNFENSTKDFVQGVTGSNGGSVVYTPYASSDGICRYLDGTGDTITFADDADYEIDSNKNYSISIVFSMSGYTAGQALMGKSVDSTDNFYGAHLYPAHASAKIRYEIRNGTSTTGTYTEIYQDGTNNATTRYDIVRNTKYGTSLYVNGNSAGASTNSTTTTAKIGNGGVNAANLVYGDFGATTDFRGWVCAGRIEKGGAAKTTRDILDEMGVSSYSINRVTTWSGTVPPTYNMSMKFTSTPAASEITQTGFKVTWATNVTANATLIINRTLVFNKTLTKNGQILVTGLGTAKSYRWNLTAYAGDRQATTVFNGTFTTTTASIVGSNSPIVREMSIKVSQTGYNDTYKNFTITDRKWKTFEEVIDDGLVLNWQFYKAGAQQNDSSGNGQNATSYLNAWTTMKDFGGVYKFNTTMPRAYREMRGTNQLLNNTIEDTNSEWTIPIWIYPTDNSTNQFVWGINNYFYIQLRTGGEIRAVVRNETSAATTLYCYKSYVNRWSLLTLDFDNSANKLTLYINGTNCTQANIYGNGTRKGGDIFDVGDVQGQTGFTGYIAEFGIWNVSLNQANISNLYSRYSTNYTYWFNTSSKQATLVMPFNNATANDLTKNNNDGTVTGATYTTAGKYGGAYSFDGVNNKITINSIIDEIEGVNKSWTWELWSKATMAQSKSLIGMNNYYYIQPRSTSNEIRFVVRNETSISTTLYCYHSYVNNWTYLALKFDNTNNMLTAYINGNNCSQNRIYGTGTRNGSTSFNIGSDSNTFFNGTIDEVKIFNYALSPEQIKADYNNREELVQQETTQGEKWSANLWASNGTTYSSAIETFYIYNYPATFTQSLTNKSIANTIGTLNYDINCSDTEGATITYYDNTTLFNINSASGLITDSPTVTETGRNRIKLYCYDGVENTTSTFYYNITNTRPTIISSRISPTAALDTDTLEGYCNASDAENNVLYYNYTWFLNKEINRSIPSYTYSETENSSYISTGVCGGESNINDGNWGTYANACAGAKTWYFYANYTIPNGANPFKTRVQYRAGVSIFNTTNPPDKCFVNGQLRVKVIFDMDTTNVKLYCYNGISYTILANVNVNSFYEQGIYWGYGSGTNATETNIANYTNLHPDQNWTLGCMAYDGNMNSSWLNSSMVHVNDIPKITNISFTPSTIYTTDNFTLYGKCVDQDTADVITGTWNIYKDSSLMYSGSRVMNSTILYSLFTVNSTATTKHEIWNASLSCSDTKQSNINYSANYEIQNTAPVMNSTRTYSPSYTIYDDLKGLCNATDVDGDTVRYYYTWYLNATENVSGVTSYFTQGQEKYVHNITKDKLRDNQNWTIECTANDGEENSSALSSSVYRVYDFNVDNCSTATTKTMMFNVFHEDYVTDHNEVSFEVDVDYWVVNEGYNRNYSGLFTGHNFTLCFSPADKNIQAHVYVKQTQADGFTHRYYISNATLSNVVQRYVLYNFNYTTGISDLRITARNKYSYNYYENVIAKLQRFYVSEGVWRTVQMDKSGDYGLLLFHIKESTTDYKILFYDLENNLLQSTQSMKFSCSGGVCSVDYLLPPFAASTADSNITSTIRYNNETHNLTVSWTDHKAGTNLVSLSVIRKTLTGDAQLCSVNQTGASGEMSCNLLGYTGEAFVSLSANGEDLSAEFVKMTSPKLSGYLTVAEQAFWSFAIMLTVIGFGIIISPVAAVLAAIAGLIILAFMGIFNAITVTFIIVAGAIGVIIGLKVKS